MKAGLWPTHLHRVENRRSGRALTLLGSIFIGRKPDFRSVTLDLQQIPTARRGRQANRQTDRLSFYLLLQCMLCFFSVSTYLCFLCVLIFIKCTHTEYFVHTRQFVYSHSLFSRNIFKNLLVSWAHFVLSESSEFWFWSKIVSCISITKPSHLFMWLRQWQITEICEHQLI